MMYINYGLKDDSPKKLLYQHFSRSLRWIFMKYFVASVNITEDSGYI